MQLAAFILCSTGAPFLPRSLRLKWGFSLATALLSIAAAAQNNPVPQIVGPVHPDAVAPGSGAFTLSVYGANFVPGSVVNWNYQPRVTTYVSGHEIQAQILATDVEANTAGYITVTNPPPGGGSSSASWAQVEVHDPVSTITMSQPQTYNFGFWQLQTADFNHDAILDLLGEYDGLSLELGVGNGTFEHPILVDGTNYSPSQFGYGDFNNDGNIDVVSFSALPLSDPLTHMRMLFGNGKGQFTEGPGLTSYDHSFYNVTVGDFNQDGNLDLVTTDGYMSSYLGNGDGTFRQQAYYSLPGVYDPVLLSGDFDGDGKLDLILANVSSVEGKTYSFAFLKGNGDGTFAEPKKIASLQNNFFCGFQSPARLSDFNGDGSLDLAFCTESQIVVMLGNGDGTFRMTSALTVDPNNDRDFTFTVGDINSDGKPDLLANDYSGGANQFLVFLGNGDGTFQPAQTISLGPNQAAELGIVTADFNNDGLLDFTFLQSIDGMQLFLQQ
jgi:hypothetical protein